MGIPKYPQFPLRIRPELISKMKVISFENGRSINKEIEQLIIKCINEYEADFGSITQTDIDKVSNQN